jgi:putative ABC transport system permease protein
LEQAGKINPNTDSWKGTDDTYIYLLLNNRNAARQLQPTLDRISDRVYADEENYRLDFKLQALDAVAPSKMLHNDLFFTIPEVALVFLSILAIIVLLTAFFNYTNLSVARGLGRAVEVGVRKVIGARRSQVFMQFTCEAIVVALVSLVLALGLLEALIFPAFEQLSFARYLDLTLKLDTELYLTFFAFSLVVGFVAGLLPATYLSAFQPVQVMKKLKNIKVFGRLGWRKALIVVQFVIALIFLISITILFDQTQYMLAKDMGFDQENLINMRLSGNELSTVKANMANIPGVKNISGTSIIPATGSNHGIYFKQPESAEVKEANRLWVDDQFIDNWGLELLAGRNFLPISDSLNRGIIINEEAVQFLGWDSNEEAIGQPLLLDANSETGGYEVSIIGVIKDFHYLTLDKAIGSLFLVNDPTALHYANIKIQTDDIRGTLADIEAAWKKIDPVHGVSYIFMDEELGEQLSIFYDLFKILGFLTSIAIFITCLGFLGIAAYSVEIRTKEIGIRKILGAELNRIIWILSKGLLYPLIIAIVVAVPLAFVVNNLWLNQFAFRVQFSLFNMGLGILFMGLISALILLSQSYRIARQNPVESLRVE